MTKETRNPNDESFTFAALRDFFAPELEKGRVRAQPQREQIYLDIQSSSLIRH
jgi:hypothetical protein